MRNEDWPGNRIDLKVPVGEIECSQDIRPQLAGGRNLTEPAQPRHQSHLVNVSGYGGVHFASVMW
jgi:hypothetical protein